MNKDFYLNERSLAGYVEKDWYDHIEKSDLRKLAFEFPSFPKADLYSDYHERLIDFLLKATGRFDYQPKRVLEVGASLGRTYFEVCSRLKTVEAATLVEPSENLASTFTKIFAGGDTAQLQVLKGNMSLEEVRLNTAPIKAACVAVQTVRIGKSFQELPADLGQFDLVICSNVIDQCKDHLKLAQLLKQATAPSGVLLLSCTYQWSDKYIGDSSHIIKDINELFDSSWQFLAETNLPFRIRAYERYWMAFLSHVVAYRH